MNNLVNWIKKSIFSISQEKKNTIYIMQRQGILYLVENIRKSFTESTLFEVWLTADKINGESIFKAEIMI